MEKVKLPMSSTTACFASLGIGFGLFLACMPVLLVFVSIAGLSCNIDSDTPQDTCDNLIEPSRLFLVFFFVFMGGPSYVDGRVIGQVLSTADYLLPAAALLGHVWAGTTLLFALFVVYPKTWWNTEENETVVVVKNTHHNHDWESRHRQPEPYVDAY